MTRISVYDVEAEIIDKICEEHDITSADLVQALLEALDDNAFDLEDYI